MNGQKYTVLYCSMLVFSVNVIFPSIRLKSTKRSPSDYLISPYNSAWHLVDTLFFYDYKYINFVKHCSLIFNIISGVKEELDTFVEWMNS